MLQHPRLLPAPTGFAPSAPDEAGGGPSFQKPDASAQQGIAGGSPSPSFQKPAGAAYSGLPGGDTAQIDTGTYELSGWWRRVGALILDGLILLIPFIIVMVLVSAVIGKTIAFNVNSDGSTTADGGTVGGVLGLLLTVAVYAVLALVYAPYFMAKWNGATPGRRAVGIRVVRADGRPMTFGFAALREVVVKQIAFGIASSFTFGLATLVDYLWPLWDSENRALHDMIVNTRVVRA